MLTPPRSRAPMESKRPLFPFTFQATISFRSGDVVFAYETIPPEDVLGNNFTAGIADAFVADDRRLYEYQRVSLDPATDIR